MLGGEAAHNGENVIRDAEMTIDFSIMIAFPG
jgi:hypothetical protein